METKTPEQRRAHKKELVTRILALEIQINNNLDNPKELSDLRADYRQVMDEFSAYYDDDPSERVKQTNH